MASESGLLDAAETIAAVLKKQGTGTVVIGAAALAAHRYVRFTDDIDLGVNVSVRDLAVLAGAIRTAGFEVALRAPDGDDPLGGVIDVSGPFGLVQIVNFGERFPAVIESAIADATVPMREGSRLRIIPLAHLIALKLYAGGRKSEADIVELLRRNPSADRGTIRRICRRYRLRGLEPLIREVDG